MITDVKMLLQKLVMYTLLDLDFWIAAIKIHMGDSLSVHPEDERIKLIL